MQFGLASEHETITLEELNNDEVEVVSGGSGGGYWGGCIGHPGSPGPTKGGPYLPGTGSGGGGTGGGTYG